MNTVYLFLAEGFEDMEAVATRDVLLRGGVQVLTVSVTEDYFVSSSHGLTVGTDLNINDFADVTVRTEDVLVFPGGMPGTKNLAKNAPLMELMREHYGDGGTVAAICAAPGLVASQLEDVAGKRFTCFEGFQDAMIAKGAVYTPEGAVVDGHLITGRAAGHAVAFGLAILNCLKGEAAVQKVKEGLLI